MNDVPFGKEVALSEIMAKEELESMVAFKEVCQ
jgi:hypothetical protein